MTGHSPKKVGGIILAAGRATRMGSTKQLLPFKDTTLLGHVTRQALDSNLDSVSIVLGHDSERIKQSLETEFGQAIPRIIMNAHYLSGQSTSLVEGLRHISKDTDGAMFLLADQPMITAAILNRIIDAFCVSAPIAAVPFHNDRRGNPVIISKELFAELRGLTGDTGARNLLKKYADRILKVDIADPAIFMDIDTHPDYLHFIEKQSR